MTTTDKTFVVEYNLAWALIWMGAILFLGTLMWGVMSPYVDTMRNVSNTTASENVTAGDTGWDRVMTAWDYWPLWFGLGMMFYGFRRALNESKRNPG